MQVIPHHSSAVVTARQSSRIRRSGNWGWALAIGCCLGLIFTGRAAAQTGFMSFSQPNYTVNQAAGTATITVVFTGSLDGDATVDFATSDGTAVAGVNYNAANGTLDFPAGGVLTNTFNIIILNTGSLQTTQTVNLALSNPTGFAVLGTPATAVLTIISTNVLQQTLQFSSATYSVNDTDPSIDITVIRNGGSTGPVSIDFKTTDGSALAGVDYTATTGTVDFADGESTNTFTIELLPPGLLETNKTLTLTLQNPTGGALLGSPSSAVLTVVAAGPPVIQFSAGNYNVLEHSGGATVTAIRFGDTTTDASVTYATSDGTAVSGTDYLGSSGTLSFPAGISSSSFSFHILEFKTFQSNKTVNVALDNPVGGSLGTQITAVVTIVNDLPQAIAFTNGTGDFVTLSLKGGGSMVVNNQDPLDLTLSGTVPASEFAIKVKKGRMGTGLMTIDQIIGDGDFRLFDARASDLDGGSIMLAGKVSQLRLHDILDGASLSTGGQPTQNSTILAHNIDDGAALSFGTRITLTAARLGAVTLDAPTIQNLVIKGDKANQIPGDCEAQITLTGEGITTNRATISSMLVAGAINGAVITVEDGAVFKVRAAQMIDSTLTVGYTPDDPSDLLGGGTFSPDLRLRRLTITAPTDGFANSVVAAPILGIVRLTSVASDNGGTPFGILADQMIYGFSMKMPKFKWLPNGADDQSLGDFHIIK